MNGDVRFGQQQHTGNAAAIAEAVEMGEQHLCAGRSRGAGQQCLERRSIAQQVAGHAVQIGQQMRAVRNMGRAHLCPPELQLPDPDVERQTPAPPARLTTSPQDISEAMITTTSP